MYQYSPAAILTGNIAHSGHKVKNTQKVTGVPTKLVQLCRAGTFIMLQNQCVTKGTSRSAPRPTTYPLACLYILYCVLCVARASTLFNTQVVQYPKRRHHNVNTVSIMCRHCDGRHRLVTMKKRQRVMRLMRNLPI